MKKQQKPWFKQIFGFFSPQNIFLSEKNFFFVLTRRNTNVYLPGVKLHQFQSIKQTNKQTK